MFGKYHDNIIITFILILFNTRGMEDEYLSGADPSSEPLRSADHCE